MADKKSLGKKWGSLKRAARGSVAKMNSPMAGIQRDNSKNDFEVFDDEAEDEFTERQKSPEEQAKITKVVSLIEHFRLQCPQTHAGLVVAFTSTTLSPLNDPGIKFKWYRMGGGVNNDQFLQIDESPRAWYPPTADDIGKKICANCEDNFDQGYCRYAEAGPVEADPLLISMVESALKNGRYEVKDISFSLGVKSLDLCQMNDNRDNMLNMFDMTSSVRPSSLVSDDAMTYPFLQFPSNVALEVNYQGIFINTAAPSSDPLVSATRRGMNILPSADLEMFCTLPASFVIVVSLPEELMLMLQKKNSRRNNKNSFSDSDEDESDGDSDDGSKQQVKKKSETEDLLGLETTTNDQTVNSSEKRGYEWIGYSSMDDAANGPGSELCMLLDSFLTTLPGGTTHVRLCFSFADRMTRDAFALSCRVLAGIQPGAGYRDRLRSLPWFSEDGEKRTVDVQSIGGSDLGRRLKELEEENSQLRRQQNELNLQLIEQSEHPNQMLPTMAFVSEDSNDDHSQAVNQMRSKVRELEKDVGNYQQKEMEWEKSSLELEGRIKRIQADGEVHASTISELQQKISETQAEAGATRVLSEKYQAEKETLKAQLDVEISENRSKVEGDMTTLREDAESARKGLKDALREMETERDEVNKYKSTIKEQEVSIVELRDQLLAAEAVALEARNLNEHRKELLKDSNTKMLEAVEEREAAMKSLAELESEMSQLRSEFDGKDEEIARLQAEKDVLLNDSVAPETYLAMEEKAIQYEAERNQQKKMTASLQKDMKKVVKELQHQIWVVEEELSRSNQRCDELKGVMAQMAADEMERVEEERRKAKSGLMGKMGMKRQSSAKH